MTVRVTNIWRHPIKAHGREELTTVSLKAGQTMPWDRVWAIAHAAAEFDHANPQWVPCQNFSRGSKAPRLMAINATVDETADRITLTHPELQTITIDPDNREDAARLIEWVTPICPTDRALPAEVVKVPQRGMTDTDFPSISINSLASLRDLSATVGTDVSPLRWRGNIWIDGVQPWQEFDWIGRTVTIGGVTLAVREPIVRCLATSSNPATGVRDLDTLALLHQHYDHQNFGVYATVVNGGEIAVGDSVSVL